ncbi:MAG TPA: 4-hydroxyphenylacetate 3-hydroxylase N-terminal domain-containing protein, partial [Stellaceae bacterium]
MRTGADYRRALRDGRRVWVMGEGLVEDVTTHPATRAMVEEYVAWYDRLADPEWAETALRPADQTPWAYVVPKSAADLEGMGRFFSATTFLSAGNITHTPCYGHLIALGVEASAREHAVSAEQAENARRYRAMIAETGRFLTFCGGGPTIGYRLRGDPAERAALKIVRETDKGLVLRGKIGMHTSPAYAEDLYVGSISGLQIDGRHVTFIVPVAAKGVTVLCRKIAVRDPNPFVAPLSSRFDELDGQMWLDDVLVPWESVFYLGQSPEPVVRW